MSERRVKDSEKAILVPRSDSLVCCQRIQLLLDMPNTVIASRLQLMMGSGCTNTIPSQGYHHL